MKRFLLSIFCIIFSITLALSQTELLTNGSMGSSSGWNYSNASYLFCSSGGYTTYRSSPCYSALPVTSTGQPGNNLTGVIQQSFNVPSNATSGTLTFYLNITSDEVTTTQKYDVLLISLSDGSTYFDLYFSNLDETSGYQKFSYNVNKLSNFLGKNIKLSLSGVTDGGKPTVFRVDDLSFVVNTANTKPDLIIEEFPSLTSSTVQAGSSTTVNFKVINQGDANANSSTTSFHIHSKSYYESGAQWIADYSTSALNSKSKTGSLSKTVTIPSGWPSGNYFILVSADGSGAINESNESNQTTYVAVTVTNPPLTGSLKVNLDPQDAVDKGAQWQVDGGSWRNSGYLETGLTTGNHTVSFKTISGYSTPSSKNIKITENSTNTISETYSNTPTPKISSDANLLDFMTTCVSTNKYFTLTNTGNSDLIVQPLTNVPSNFSTDLNSIVTIKPNANKQVFVNFFPDGVTGSYSGTINILSNAVNGTVQVNLIGKCEAGSKNINIGFDKNGIYHLMWPFYNEFKNGMNNKTNAKSNWNNQKLNGSVGSEWYYSTHAGHTGKDAFAQDWSYPPSGDSDCGLHFYSPLQGEIIAVRNTCGEACSDAQSDNSCGGSYGNSVMIRSLKNKDVVFMVAHLTRISDDIYIGKSISVNEYIGDMGMTGNGDAAHFHCMTNKGLSQSDIDYIINNQRYPESDACSFLFDATESGGSLLVSNDKIIDLRVFPNPATNNFNISFYGHQEEKVKVLMFDFLGREVLALNLNVNPGGNIENIPFELPIGSYTIQIRGTSWMVNSKLMVRS